MDVPNLRHLAIVGALVGHRTMRSAAEALGLSQPALTQALRKLEEHLGTVLFERGKAGVFATEAGRVLAMRVDRARDYLVAAERSLGLGSPLRRRATAAQLHAFIHVVQAGGTVAAARQMGVSQPSVHRAVRDIETIAGKPLFQRSPYGLEPTREARELSRAASLAFSEIRQGMAALRELRGVVDGQLRVGCLPYARAYLVPEAATQLLLQFPALKLILVDGSYEELLGLLRHGEIDMIISALRHPPPMNDIRQEKLFNEPLSIVVRADHPILKQPKLNAAKLAGLDWIVPRDGTPARTQFAAFFKRHKIAEPANVIQCSSLAVTRGLLLRSDRAALLSAGQVCYETEKGDLVVMSKPLPGVMRTIGVTTRADFVPTAAHAAFMTQLRKAAASR